MTFATQTSSTQAKSLFETLVPCGSSSIAISRRFLFLLPSTSPLLDFSPLSLQLASAMQTFPSDLTSLIYCLNFLLAWASGLEALVKTVTEDLGLANAAVKANLYKLLLYGPGQHFKEFHKDTEKEDRMFGTLIIQLPSVHEGGEITFRFKGVETTYDFGVGSGLAQFEPYYVAHYADVDHKIAPITNGFRLAFDL